MLTVLGTSQLIYTQSTRNSVSYYNEQIKQRAQRTATDGANSQFLPLLAQPSSCFFSPLRPSSLYNRSTDFADGPSTPSLTASCCGSLMIRFKSCSCAALLQRPLHVMMRPSCLNWTQLLQWGERKNPYACSPPWPCTQPRCKIQPGYTAELTFSTPIQWQRALPAHGKSCIIVAIKWGADSLSVFTHLLGLKGHALGRLVQYLTYFSPFAKSVSFLMELCFTLSVDVFS